MKLKTKKRLKKGIYVLLLLVVAIAFVACGGAKLSGSNVEVVVPDADGGADKDMILIEQNEKCGALDKTGKQIFPNEYDSIECVGPDRYLLTQKKQTAIVNSKNEEIVPFGEYRFSAGYYNMYDRSGQEWVDCIAALDCATGKYGYYSATDNTWAIEPVFQKAAPFDGPITAVKDQNDRWGFINTEGEYVIPAKYKDVELDSYRGFQDDEDIAAVVTEDGRTVYALRTGEEIYPSELEPGCEVEGYWNGCLIIYRNERWGVSDKTGKIIIPVKYSYGYTSFIITKNFIAVHVQELDGEIGRASKWELFDHTGKKMEGRTCSDISDFDNVLITTVSENDTEKYGMIDQNGTEILPCVYDAVWCINDSWDLSRFGNDDVTFAVRKNEDSKISLYNKNGEELIHEEFDDIEEFPEELDICAVECEGKVGFIDRKGNYLLEPTFDAYQGDDMDLPVNPCFWGKDFGLIPDKKTGRYALLDKDFNVITDYKFTDIGPVDCGLIAVCDDKGWSVVNTKGEEVIPSGEYEEIDTIFKNGMILVKDSGSGKYGFVNADGEQLTEFKYEVYHWTD